MTDRSPLPLGQAATLARHLFRLSESRGKEAAGFCAATVSALTVFKSAQPASCMLESLEYARALQSVRDLTRFGHLALIGHSRLETTGSHWSADNNQPVVRDGSVGIHNGIIVNCDETWARFPRLQRRVQVDSELLFALLDHRLDAGDNPLEAVAHSFSEIKGTASVAALSVNRDILLLATNNGSLYTWQDEEATSFVFASERHILDRLLHTRLGKRWLAHGTVRHLEAGSACLVNLLDARLLPFSLTGAQPPLPPGFGTRSSPRTVSQLPGLRPAGPAPTRALAHVGLTGLVDASALKTIETIRRRYPFDSTWQDGLRRCTRCILPSTMPFIEFDAAGVCNYCRDYRRIPCHGPEALRARVDALRVEPGRPDCVVGISGGRDSLYSLHYLRTVLRLNPVAYTYDWGMVTDLARRNTSRICAALGVEHIIVAADIVRKRAHIRRNLQAWLRKPDLGMIPLFMAGDKMYFHYLRRVQQQTGARFSVLGENMLERTDFKTGFAGVRPHNQDAEHVYTLPRSAKVGLAAYYLRQYLSNPAYLNASLWDTAWAYFSYYVQQRDYLNLYTFIPWKEDEIISTLTREYGFERAPDSPTTWRIGDGTAAFYNYIYFQVAGFTENDTFRSNQVREGLLTREEALRRVKVENQPRYETLYWYLGVVQMEDLLEQVFRTIHSMPRLKAHDANG
jgi:hypothetical protein